MTLRKRHVAAALVLLCTGMAATPYLGDDRESSPETGAEIRTSGEAERLQLRALQGQVHGLRQELAALRDGPGEPADGEETETRARERSADPEATEPLAGMTTAEKRAMLVDALDDQLTGEGRDATWSGETERALADVFADEIFPGSHLDDAECRSTVCRLRVSHDDDDVRQGFLAEIPSGPPFDGEGYFHKPEGSQETVVYLVRRGHTLPPAPWLDPPR